MSGTGLSGFLAMGGYGLYVWGSLGMCAATLLIEVVLLRLRHRALLRDMAHEPESGNDRSTA